MSLDVTIHLYLCARSDRDTFAGLEAEFVGHHRWSKALAYAREPDGKAPSSLRAIEFCSSRSGAEIRCGLK